MEKERKILNDQIQANFEEIQQLREGQINEEKLRKENKMQMEEIAMLNHRIKLIDPLYDKSISIKREANDMYL